MILEDNNNHTDSKNEKVHELIDVEFEHLLRRYQHLFYLPPNQSRQLAMTNAAMGLMLPKGIKLLNLTIYLKIYLTIYLTIYLKI